MNTNDMFEKETGVQKKKIRITTIIGLSAIVIGIILFVIGAVFFDKNTVKEKLKGVSYKNDFADDKVSIVDIDIDYGKVNVSKSKDGKFHVSAENVSEDFSAEVSGHKFVVKSDDDTISKNVLYNIFTSYENAEVNIEMPEKEYNEFRFDLSAGKCQLSDVSGKKFVYDISAGESRLENISGDSMDIDMSAGKIEIVNAECKNAEVDMSAGHFNVDGFKCDTMNLDSSAGSIEIKSMENSGVFTVDMSAGKIEVSDTVTGGINADMSAGKFGYSGTVNGDVKIDSSAGEVKMNLTNPESDFTSKYRMNVNCDSGRQNISYNCK